MGTAAKASIKTTTRAYPRADVSGRVFIHDEERLYIAPLSNLSAGGIFVGDLVALPEGSRVRVVVKSPSLAAPVQALGSVVRVESEDRRGLAVQFTAISRKARDVISTCVSETQTQKALKVTGG